MKASGGRLGLEVEVELDCINQDHNLIISERTMPASMRLVSKDGLCVCIVPKAYDQFTCYIPDLGHT